MQPCPSSRPRRSGCWSVDLFRSDRLAHTLLPKRIALPVFASDALSRVAYAPEEIFLTLSVAGLSAYAFAPWIGVDRGHRHARRGRLATGRTCTPTPAAAATTRSPRTNLGGKFGLTVASALLVDYVLTVAVSTSSGIANIGSAHPVRRPAPGAVLPDRAGAADRGQPARHPRVRRGLRHPDLRVHGRRVRHGHLGRGPGDQRGGPARRKRRFPPGGVGHVDGRRRVRVPDPALVLLRLCRADRCRGDQQRRARLPQAEVARTRPPRCC